MVQELIVPKIHKIVLNENWYWRVYIYFGHWPVVSSITIVLSNKKCKALQSHSPLLLQYMITDLCLETSINSAPVAPETFTI